MYVRPAHFDLPMVDLLTKSTANQAVSCLAITILTFTNQMAYHLEQRLSRLRHQWQTGWSSY
jgi:hypothetical protein